MLYGGLESASEGPAPVGILHFPFRIARGELVIPELSGVDVAAREGERAHAVEFVALHALIFPRAVRAFAVGAEDLPRVHHPGVHGKVLYREDLAGGLVAPKPWDTQVTAHGAFQLPTEGEVATLLLASCGVHGLLFVCRDETAVLLFDPCLGGAAGAMVSQDLSGLGLEN